MDTQCNGGLCFAEATSDLPGGLCSEDCTSSGTCTDATASFSFGASDFCLRDCDPNVAGSCGSPSTLTCLPVTGSALGGACFPECTSAADCTVAGNVCKADTTCGVTEICNNAINDDNDAAVDCEDSECETTAGCASSCASPTVLTLNVTVNGNTVGGTNNLLGSCQSSGSHERVFQFTPATTGNRTITLTSATDQGFYVRSTCNTGASELVCEDAVAGGTNEVATVAVTAGVPIFIVVDGFQPGEEGPFTIRVN